LKELITMHHGTDYLVEQLWLWECAYVNV